MTLAKHERELHAVQPGTLVYNSPQRDNCGTVVIQ